MRQASYLRSTLFGLSLAVSGLCYSAQAQPNSAAVNDSEQPLVVISSIKPIQLLVAAIAGDLTAKGIIDNQLLLPTNVSPHDYAMKFSDTKKLKNADIVFWIGESLETFLDKPLKLAKEGRVVSFNAKLNPLDKHHTKAYHAHKTHKHEPGLGHIHKEPHPWLSPVHAVKMANIIKTSLSELKPEHSAIFARNAHRFTQEMIKIERDYKVKFIKINQNKDTGFIVFHDAYADLVSHFKLNQLAVVTPMAGRNPKLRHILKLRQLVDQGRVNCIISEPNANTKILSRIIPKDNKTKNGKINQTVIDPIAAKIPLSSNGFSTYFNSILASLEACIK